MNRDDLDFDSAESSKPTQEFKLLRDNVDVVEYQTRIAKFNNVQSIALYFDENYGNDVTRISYIGFKGEWQEIQHEPFVAIYEANANPADHPKTKAENEGQQPIM